MRISANEIKIGNILDYEGALWMVAKNPEHTKPGKGPAYIQVEMKNIITGTKLNHRFGSTDHVQRAHLEQKEMQFLYSEDKNLVLMDPESFEQILISQDFLGERLPFIVDGMVVTVESYGEKVLGIKLPTTAVVEIAETAPSIKGSTVTSSYKPAILTNGMKVMVPPYLVLGEKIVVKTEDTTFVERAK